MYRYLSLAILCLCMKYESCTLKTSRVIVWEAKCWKSSVVTLTFNLLTPKCIGIFLVPSFIYVRNMTAVRWKLLTLSCQNQSVDGQTDGLTDRKTSSGGALIMHILWIIPYLQKGFLLNFVFYLWNLTRRLGLYDGPCSNLLRGDKVLIFVPSDC